MLIILFLAFSSFVQAGPCLAKQNPHDAARRARIERLQNARIERHEVRVIYHRRHRHIQVWINQPRRMKP